MLILGTSFNIIFPNFKHPLEKPKNNPRSRDIKKSFLKSTWQSLKHPLMKNNFTQKNPNLKFSLEGKVS
jgi:hypothetical protein